jgi:hypothetical protein
VSTALVALGLGLLIGVTVGAFGGGGGVLTVPVLVSALDQPVSAAIPASLVLVGLTAALGAVEHGRAGQVRWRTGVVVAAAGAPAAVLGAALSARADPDLLLLAIAALTLVAAVALLRPAGTSPVPVPAPAGPLRTATAGGSLGLVAGLLGVGGGFLAVPTLTVALRLTVRDAIGTSLLVIALNSATALLAHTASAAPDWSVVGPLAAAALVGTAVGTRAARRVPARVLTRAFAVLLVGVAVATAVTVLR